MSRVVSQFRQSLRALASRPGYALLVVSTLGLGIGVCSAMFSVVETVLLTPLPYHEPERMVLLRCAEPVSPMVPMTPAQFEHLRDHGETLEAATAFDRVYFHLEREQGPERVSGALVTTDFFEVLGVEAARGRTFDPSDAELSEGVPVVVTDSFWRTELSGSEAAIGERLDMTWTASFGPRRRLPEDFVVAGILGSDFVAPMGSPQLFAPLVMPDTAAYREASYLFAFARLAQGVEIEAAKSELDVLVRALGADGLPPEIDPEKVGVTVMSLAHRSTERIATALWVLFAAVGLVLLIACANVAHLVLVRSLGRRREIAVRAALGASRPTLVLSLFLESALLAGASVMVGLGIGWASLRWLQAAQPEFLPRLERIALDPTVALFAAVTGALSLLGFGLLPAWLATGRSATSRLRVGSLAAHPRWAATLVVTEMAIAVPLLIGAGLLIRSFDSLSRVDLGFDAERLATFEVALPSARYIDAARREYFYTQAREELSRIPGVAAVAVTSGLPLTSLNTATMLRVPGWEDPEGGAAFASYRNVSDGYFETLGVPLQQGRMFEPEDVLAEPRVAVVNRSFAERFWPSAQPLGRTVDLLSLGLNEIEVVGVVGDVRDVGPRRPVRPTVFLPRLPRATAGFALRTRGDSEQIFAAIQSAIAQVDEHQPIHDLRTFESAASRWMGREAFNASLISAFAFVALALACVGLFGAASWTVARQVPEIGLRMALGAAPGRVVSSVLTRHVGMAGVGLLLGLGLALILGRFLSALLHGVGSFDLPTYATIAVVLLASAALAAAVPGFRASRVEPTLALRVE